jgi:hypothetical protein
MSAGCRLGVQRIDFGRQPVKGQYLMVRGLLFVQETSQSVVPVIDRRLKSTEITDHMITPDKSSPVF